MRARVMGFTYLGLLFAVILLGVVLSVGGVVWHTQSRREKERELLFVGAQYRQAIEAYRALVVNGQRMYPRSLDDLLEDRRFPMPVRHLRKRYRDPMTHAREWGLVRTGDAITGVFSLSNEVPFKKVNFGLCCEAFEGARTYADWKFAVTPEAEPATQQKPAIPARAPAGAAGPSTRQP